MCAPTRIIKKAKQQIIIENTLTANSRGGAIFDFGRNVLIL